MTQYDAMTYGDRRCMDCGKPPSLHDGPMEQCAKKQPAWCDPSLSREERISACESVVTTKWSKGIVCDACRQNGCVEATADRYGYQCDFCRCELCGLGWLWRRQNSAWYANFYASGTYRKLVSAYHGRDVMATIREEQEQYAKSLWPKITRHVLPCSVLDIGSSTGMISRHWFDNRNKRAAITLVDPAANEGRCRDWATVIAEPFETANVAGEFECILLCQTIDHLLEPRLCLEKIRGLLASDGLFFVDILDTEQEVAQKGWQQTLKIDHPTYFTDKSARLLLSATGFEIVDSWESAPHHIGYLCKGRVCEAQYRKDRREFACDSAS